MIGPTEYVFVALVLAVLWGQIGRAHHYEWGGAVGVIAGFAWPLTFLILFFWWAWDLGEGGPWIREWEREDAMIAHFQRVNAAKRDQAP